MIQLIYRYTCDACAAVKDVLYGMDMSCDPPRPCHPIDWTYIPPISPVTGLYCEKHNIRVTITKRQDRKPRRIGYAKDRRKPRRSG
jgi:hypothetical protein